MTWSASVVRRVFITWPRRRPPKIARRRGPYRDMFFADPNAVEDDYRRMRRQ